MSEADKPHAFANRKEVRQEILDYGAKRQTNGSAFHAEPKIMKRIKAWRWCGGRREGARLNVERLVALPLILFHDFWFGHGKHSRSVCRCA